MNDMNEPKHAAFIYIRPARASIRPPRELERWFAGCKRASEAGGEDIDLGWPEQIWVPLPYAGKIADAQAEHARQRCRPAWNGLMGPFFEENDNG